MSHPPRLPPNPPRSAGGARVVFEAREIAQFTSTRRISRAEADECRESLEPGTPPSSTFFSFRTSSFPTKHVRDLGGGHQHAAPHPAARAPAPWGGRAGRGRTPGEDRQVPWPSAAAAVRALAVLGVLAGAARGPGPAEARATVFGAGGDRDLRADSASFPLDKGHPEGLRAEGARVGAQWVMLECYAPW